MLYFLDLGDRVQGVTEYSDFPPAARFKPRVGSYVQPNPELIFGLAPDLVLGTVDGNRRSDVTRLTQAGIPVFVVNPRTLQSTLETIDQIAVLCGVGFSAGPRVAALRERVAAVGRKVASRPRPRVFLQINQRPVMTVSRHTFHQDLIRLAGGENIFADLDATYPRVTIEEVIRRNPEVIVISVTDPGRAVAAAACREWRRWPCIQAVRDGKVFVVNADLLDRPAPRIVEGLERLAALLHPEAE